ncbi:MAG TPA: PAS domain S-box protein [Tepidisphaeraceae bacterium]|nr:PAS domain S-box protein [Tepidisphaeraceae bacterium]
MPETFEQELQDFFDNASVGLHWVAADGTILRANRAELELLGYAPEEYVGQHIANFHADADVINDILQRLARGETLCNYEARLKCKDGTIRHVMINSNVLWREGKFVHTRCFTRDITDSKRNELRMLAEHAVTRVLAESSSLKEATPRILEAVCRTTGWEWAALWTVDTHENALRCVEIWHRPETTVAQFEQLSRQTLLSHGVGLPGRAWQSGRAEWIADVSVNGNFPRREAAAEAGLHGALAFPILVGEQVVGVMEFFSRQVRDPDQTLLDMMLTIGTQIGQYMQRKRIERSLRESEARNAAVLTAALDCLVSMDHRGTVIEWNPAAERTFGYTRSEALGREMAELIIPPQLREQHRKGLAKYLVTGEGPVLGKRIEITAGRKDGTEFPVELAITRIPFEGPPTFTGHLRDITERKISDEERTKLLASEQQARRDAEAANRMKDEFLSVVSHELRTPLNAILGWSQILDGPGRTDPESLKEGLQVIQRNARVQTQIIEDILDLSRVVSGKVRLDVQRVDLTSVIEAAIESMQPAADAKNIRIQKVLDPLAGPVSGDPARLQQVIWNLLSNAIKFTPKGGRVRVTLERVNSHVEISVSDTGAGIKPEFLPHVFERFTQGDGTTTRRYGGLGLGLSITKHLVELHGGTVQAKSPGEGAGSTFRVALPLTPLQQDEPEFERRHPTAGKATAIEGGQPTLRAVKVLVVDDEPDARTLIKRLLENCEAVVTTATSVEEALELLDSTPFDVIVSDIGMPDRDGYDLARSLRSLLPAQGGKTPAVALTAFARSEDRTRAMLAGFDMHVAKPVEPSELCAVVARLAGRTAPVSGA